MSGSVSMAGAWEVFEELLLDGAGAVQRKETRRAFYAGAQAVFDIQMHGLDPGSEPTDADMERMNRLAREIEQFALDIQAGRA